MEFLSVMGDHFVMLGEDERRTDEGKKKDKVLEEELKLSREMGPWRKRPGGDLKWLNLRLTRSSKIRAIVLMDDEVTK